MSEVAVYPVVVDVVVSPAIVEVSSQGLQGIPGTVGPAGSGGGISIPFGYGDASPKPLATIVGLVKSARIVILNPFNGAPSSLRVGDAGASDRLIKTSQNNPSEADTYGTNPAYEYLSATQVFLTIGLGDNVNQGSGVVILEV
jgi:hypothetical protein